MNNVISIILGFIIGYIIFYIYDKKRIIYHGPNSKNIIKNIYKKNGKCYKLIPKVVICPLHLSTSI